MSAALERLYAAARAFAQETPALAAFRAMPAVPPLQRKSHTSAPALERLAAHFPTGDATETGAAVARSVIEAASEIDWLLTYTEDQVGSDFLSRYCWFELLGPTGHFHSDEMVAFIAYWGPGLRYPWHRHEAEEVYSVIDGACLFEAEGRTARAVTSGGISVHAPWQAHALRTEEAPVLVMALQAGSGLNDVPEILAEPCASGQA